MGRTQIKANETSKKRKACSKGFSFLGYYFSEFKNDFDQVCKSFLTETHALVVAAELLIHC